MVQVKQGLVVSVLGLGAEGIWTWATLALLAELMEPTRFPFVACWSFYPGAVLLGVALRLQPVGRRPERVVRCIVTAIALGLLGWRTVAVLEPSFFPAGIYLLPFSLIAASVLAWAGWTFVNRPITPGGQLFRFQIGAAVLVLVAAVASITRADLRAGALLIVSFFVLSFAGLAITRSARNAEGRPTWTALAIGAGALVVIVSLLIIAIVSPSTIGAIFDAIGRFLVGLLPDSEPRQPPSQPTPPPENVQEIANVVNIIMLSISVAVGVAVLGGMLLLLFLQLRYWLQHPPTHGVEMERLRPSMSPCKAWAMFIVSQLARWRAALQRRLLPQRTATDAPALYRLLQRWGRKQGIPRATHQTPLEYLDTLGSRWPAQRADFFNITQAYVLSHYGDKQPTADAMGSLSQSWRAVKRLRKPWPVRAIRRLQHTLKGSTDDQY